MYTTHLSTLISSLSLYHHLYADDTTFFLSLHPSDFQASSTHLQNALTQITFLMTSNLLSLNSSKTEFLLIGLKRQLANRSFRHASPHLWNQLPTSLRIPHPNYSSPSQRPSFKHAGLTGYTLLSPFITFHCFTRSSKLTFSENLILHLSLFPSVELISWL